MKEKIVGHNVFNEEGKLIGWCDIGGHITYFADDDFESEEDIPLEIVEVDDDQVTVQLYQGGTTTVTKKIYPL